MDLSNSGKGSSSLSVLGKRKYKVCRHCKALLTQKRFKEHKNLFYDEISKKWTTVNDGDEELSDISDVAELLLDPVSEMEEDSGSVGEDWEFSASPSDITPSTTKADEHSVAAQNEGIVMFSYGIAKIEVGALSVLPVMCEYVHVDLI